MDIFFAKGYEIRIINQDVNYEVSHEVDGVSQRAAKD